MATQEAKSLAEIVSLAQEHVLHLFQKLDEKKYTYHNLQHTAEVVNAVEEIAAHAAISEHEKSLVLIAAWFHDAGYLKGHKKHEQRSIKAAKKFLKNFQLPEEDLQKIYGCIRATEIPQSPRSLMEEV